MALVAACGFRRNLGTGESLSFVRHEMKRSVFLVVCLALIPFCAYGKDDACKSQALKRAKELFLFHLNPEVKDSPIFSYGAPSVVKKPYKKKGNLLVQLDVIAQVDDQANYAISMTFIEDGCHLVGEEIYEDWAKR